MDNGISIRSLAVGTSTYVIVLSGSLDERTAPAVSAALERGSGLTTIVDLLDVSFFDATGASALERHELVVVADRPTLHRLGAAGGKDQTHVYASLTDALASAVAV